MEVFPSALTTLLHLSAGNVLRPTAAGSCFSPASWSSIRSVSAVCRGLFSEIILMSSAGRHNLSLPSSKILE